MKKYLLASFAAFLCLLSLIGAVAAMCLHQGVWAGTALGQAFLWGWTAVERFLKVRKQTGIHSAPSGPTVTTTYLQGADAMLSISSPLMAQPPSTAFSSAQQAFAQAQVNAKMNAGLQGLSNMFGNTAAPQTSGTDMPTRYYQRLLWEPVKTALEGRAYQHNAGGISDEVVNIIHIASSAAADAINKHFAPPEPTPEPTPYIYQDAGELRDGREA